MLLYRFPIFLTCLFLIGCASNYTVTKAPSRASYDQVLFEDFRKNIVGKFAVINLGPDEQKGGTVVAVEDDAILLAEFNDTLSLPIRNIRSVSLPAGSLSPFIAAPLGGFVGGIIGGTIGKSSSGFWGGFSGFAIGMVVGATGGLAFALFDLPPVVYEIQFSGVGISEHRAP